MRYLILNGSPLTTADNGWVSYELADGYTYSFDAADLVVEGIDVLPAHEHLENAGAAGAEENEPTLLFDDFLIKTSLGSAREKKTTHDLLMPPTHNQKTKQLKIMQRCCALFQALPVGLVVSALPRLLQPAPHCSPLGEGHRHCRPNPDNSHASHAQSEPPMNPRARFGALKTSKIKSCITMCSFLAAPG